MIYIYIMYIYIYIYIYIYSSRAPEAAGSQWPHRVVAAFARARRAGGSHSSAAASGLFRSLSAGTDFGNCPFCSYRIVFIITIIIVIIIIIMTMFSLAHSSHTPIRAAGLGWAAGYATGSSGFA